MAVRQSDRRPGKGVTVAVLGPGAVGGVLAVCLLQAGVRVICIARPDTADVIRSQGLSLRRGSEVQTARPEAETALDEPVELLLVTVKAPALDDALDRVQAPVETVVPLLNGVEHMEALRGRLSDSRVVAGSIGWIEAYLERPGVVVQNTPGVVMTLSSDGDGPTAELLTQAGVDVRFGGTEAAVLWEKLARQAPVAAATAATQRPIGELRTDPETRLRLEQAIDETCAVAGAEGVSLDPAAQWVVIDSMLPALTSSTARDIAAGRPSELDAITGAAVRAAHRHGVPVPALEGLLAEAEEACRALSR
jgi:2-dehydropantoate 2-reductase